MPLFRFYLFAHIYHPFTRKRIVSPSFGWDVYTPLKVVVSEVFGHLPSTYKGGAVPLSTLAKDTTSEFAGLFSTISLNVEHRAEKLRIPFLKVFLVWFDKRNEPQVYRLQRRRSNHYPSRLRYRFLVAKGDER